MHQMKPPSGNSHGKPWSWENQLNQSFAVHKANICKWKSKRTDLIFWVISGGAIIERNLVVTAAHCVDGLRTHDVLIKGGEWKLGSTEEPKPFQTVRVKQITMHPAYEPTNLESDVALLHLENDLKFDKHIGPICVDESELEPTKGSDEECVTSGWGKEIIKCKSTIHYNRLQMC